MGNSATSLPYDNGAAIEYSAQCSHWQLSAGLKKEDKEDKEQVTIFRFAKSQADKVPVASRNLQKLRTLKHPYILSFLDGADLEDSLLLVTESCVPLETWLQQKASSTSSSSSSSAAEDVANLSGEVVWGLRCVVNALQFLHSTCSLVHGYLGMHSIFVAKNGDWKLGALDLACNLNLPDDASYFNTYNHLLVRPFISPERQQPNAASSLQSAPGSADIFALAHCIQIIYDKLRLEIPANFAKYLQRMLVVEVARRPTAGQLGQCPIFNSDQVKLFISLGDLAIKPPSESLEILGNLVSRVPDIPRAVCIHKILPSVGRALQMVINDFPTRNARESCRQSVQLSMTLLAQLASQNKLDEPNYVSKCLPVVVQLWSMNDRAIRTTLLKTLKSLIGITPASHINKSIFEPMLAGFADSNAKMREDTLKNLAHVVDKLDEKNLQDKLIRCISNLQNDAESSIRTNATIFLGRTASRLKDTVRTRVICPAFAKAMRDPFVHCRFAGLKAAVACIELLDLQQLTCKIMPQACLLLMDRSADVREMSLTLLDASSALLRQYHDKTTKSDKLAAAAAAAAAAASNGSGGGDASAGGGGGGAQQTGGGSSWTSWVSDGLSKTIEKVAVTADDSDKPRSASMSGNGGSGGGGGDGLGPRSTSSSTASASSGGGGGVGGGGGGGGSVKTGSRANSSSNVSLDQDTSFVGNLPADGWGNDDDWGVDDDEGAGGGGGGKGWGAADDDLDLDDDDDVFEDDNNKPGNVQGTLRGASSSSKSNAPNQPSVGKLVVPAAAAAAPVIGGLTNTKVTSTKPLPKAVKPVVKKLGADSDVSWDDF